MAIELQGVTGYDHDIVRLEVSGPLDCKVLRATATQQQGAKHHDDKTAKCHMS